jgi:hypothetical protein
MLINVEKVSWKMLKLMKEGKGFVYNNKLIK